jgi:aconitate hydratase
MNSFGARTTLTVGCAHYEIYRLAALADRGIDISHLPYGLRILLENLLRTEDGQAVTAADIRSLARWNPQAVPATEIAFTPARVLLHDFTGVPAVVDLAAMRDAMTDLGGDPARINPRIPVDLIIDHSVQVDAYGSAAAPQINANLEFARNQERYALLRWGQGTFRNFALVPPDTGIVHQINLEYLARVVFTTPAEGDALPQAYPDTLVGADSHTPMINGLGVLGWGVGGIEAEAVMLGQPITMRIPQIVGVHLTGTLPDGVTATDLVLTITALLRAKGVVGKFVEFYGPGLAALPVADRATIANMAPEYGATCSLFPVDTETLRYLRFTGRSAQQVALVEAYYRVQGLFHTADSPVAHYSDTVELDLSTVEPSVAGPKRPQDRVALRHARRAFEDALEAIRTAGRPATPPPPIRRWEDEGGHPADSAGTPLVTRLPGVRVQLAQDTFTLDHGAIVIAAITSCTNTSNPALMVAAGLLAKKAVERGLATPPWVKTSLAPGSRVVTEYLNAAGLTPYLDRLRFHTVGYGCTTCIGNSGPLPEAISNAVTEGDLVVVSVLSGNRNFEGRINAEVRANYLMSPPLVVAYALAGRMGIDLLTEPLGRGSDGQPVYLRDIWPAQGEIQETMEQAVRSEMFRASYAAVFTGEARWDALAVPAGERFAWDPASTYVCRPPYFAAMRREAPERVPEITGARALAVLGDSVTTDHISPAGSIRKTSPAGQYLLAQGVAVTDFNTYGARRGNHEVLMRGTFANVRLRNRLAPGTEGGFTTLLPEGTVTTIYDAAQAYQAAGVPLLILAGKQYGTGSSRDWAAKGPALLGVRAVIAESFERIHRANLIGMGILPLQFVAGESVDTLGLTGREVYDVLDLPVAAADAGAGDRRLRVRATREDGSVLEFAVTARIDTPQEMQYYRHGGILPYVLRRLLPGGEDRHAALPAARLQVAAAV